MSEQQQAAEGQTTPATETAPPAPPKTRAEKLLEKYNKIAAKVAELTQERDELASEINSITLLSSVAVGTTVYFPLGRKDAVKEVQGVVAGIREDEETGAKTFKVAYGSGFDTDVAVVKAGKIRLQPTPVQEAQAPATQVAG